MHGAQRRAGRRSPASRRAHGLGQSIVWAVLLPLAVGRQAVRTGAQTSQHLSHHDKAPLAYTHMPYIIKGLSRFFCACGDGPAMSHPSPVVLDSRDLQTSPAYDAAVPAPYMVRTTAEGREGKAIFACSKGGTSITVDCKYLTKAEVRKCAAMQEAADYEKLLASHRLSEGEPGGSPHVRQPSSRMALQEQAIAYRACWGSRNSDRTRKGGPSWPVPTIPSSLRQSVWARYPVHRLQRRTVSHTALRLFVSRCHCLQSSIMQAYRCLAWSLLSPKGRGCTSIP